MLFQRRYAYMHEARVLKYSHVVFVVLVILVFGSLARFHAQGLSPHSQTPGAPAGTYKLSEFENINLFNGNVNINLPLVSTVGRGGLGPSLSLTLDNQWGIQGQEDAVGNILYQFTATGTGSFVGYLENPSPNPIFLHQQEPCINNTFTYWVIHQWSLRYVEPDGTQHALIDPTYHGLPHYECGATSVNYGRVFKSSNSEFMTFIADADIQTNSGALTGYLFLKDGTASRIENGKVLSTTDRNGNKTEYTYGASNQRLSSMKDSIGREVSIEYGVTESSPYGLCDRITVKGFGGAARVIRISRVSYESDASEFLRMTQPGDPSSVPTIAERFNDDPNDTFIYLNGSDSLYRGPNVKAVWLPDGRSYQFKYSVYGRIARIVLPTGGAIEYDYATPVLGIGSADADVWHRVSEKRTYDATDALISRTTFVDSSSNGSIDVDEFAASGNRLSCTKHYFDSTLSAKTYPYVFTWKTGREYKTEHYAANGTTLLRTVEMEFRQRRPAWCTYGTELDCQANNPFLIETTTILADANLVSKVTSINPSSGDWAIDSFNNVQDVWYFDYGSGAPGALLRHEHTDYVTSSNYVNRYLLSLPSEKWISTDQSGTNKVSRTRFEYDNYATDSAHAGLVSRSSVSGHDSSGYGASFIYRGNVTAVTSYADAGPQTGGVSSYSQYDILGNVVKTIDANGNATTIGYSDNFGSPDSNATTNSSPGQLGGLSTFAFPTSTTNPKGWTSYIQYDYFTGSPVNAQDINELISKTIYDDPLDRPTQTVTGIGTANEIQSSVDYDDVNRTIETRTDLFALNDGLQKSELVYDSLGRTIERRSYSEGDYVTIKTEFDSLGRVKKVSNPFRPERSETAIWTETTYDALGRVIEVETPDGAAVSTTYDGNRTLVIDQAGKKRISRINALGQLKDIWEITAADASTESITFPNQSLSAGYRTSYTYDGLSNLTEVSQGSQTRQFTYNNLSRLLSASNPESGTITYTYDPNGNLKTKRDARNIKTVFDYDELNRVTKRCHRSIGTGPLGMTTCVSNNETQEPNTSDVTYTLENPSITNLKGVLTKVANGNSITEYIGFDATGRVTRTKQTTDGVVYGDDTNPMTYAYSLSGALLEQKYPSGRVVKNVLDQDSRLAILQSKKTSSSGYWNYASSFSYNAAGAVTSTQLGNGRWESTVYNSRLQPTDINLGTVKGGHDKLRLQYNYGDWNGSSIDATKNNGNIVNQIITVPNSDGNTDGFAATQKYNYDSLNRIDDATEEVSSQTWRQDFSYDRYGNRNLVEANTTTIPRNCGTSPNFTICTADQKKYNPSINSSNNNRIDTSQGYSFDAAGNTTVDSSSNTFVYDGDNKQVEAKNSGNYTIGRYYYDGDGKRVKKIAYNSTGTEIETTIFVYDAAGKEIAEYSDVVESSNNAKVAYLTNDHLGSPRINTDANGAVTARHDYHPFGEEVATPQRTAHMEYGADTVRKQFTGYERDRETDLDFAQARMYANRLGRFSSVDSVGPDVTNPQTLNKYQYCLDNPLRYIDKNGKYEEDVHRDLTRELAYAAGFSIRQATAIGSENQYIDEGRTNPVGYGPEAYRARSEHHFTTEEQRNSLWVDFDNAARSQNETNQLMRLGTYLHAQQDSFSHAGYGPLLGQATDLFKDGIVPSYEAASRADKTDTDPAKAERMAQDTFKRLVSARNMIADSGRSGSFYRPISYGAIKPLVGQWVRESDPQKKAAILTEIRKKIQNGRDVQDFPRNVVNAPKRKRQGQE